MCAFLPSMYKNDKNIDFLTPGSGSGIQIPNPDPQIYWIRIHSGSGSTPLVFNTGTRSGRFCKTDM
jgi:hypothetical protein